MKCKSTVQRVKKKRRRKQDSHIAKQVGRESACYCIVTRIHRDIYIQVHIGVMPTNSQVHL
jgi:hypothetical protein